MLCVIEMAKNIIILSLVFAFLIFGCLGAGEAEEGPPGAPPAGDGQPPAEDGQPPAEGPPPADGGVDFAGLDYAGAVALGVPIECDITTYMDGESTTVKLYAKGENEIMYELVPEDPEDCAKFIWINKDYNVYVGCEGGHYPPETTCNWLLIAAAADEEEPTGEMEAPGAYESPALENVPSTQISCRPWLYDASKFQTSGKVCTFEDLMQEMTGGAYGDYSDY